VCLVAGNLLGLFGRIHFLHVFGSAVSEKIILSFLVETIMKYIPLYPPLQTTVKRISISTYLEKHKA